MNAATAQLTWGQFHCEFMLPSATFFGHALHSQTDYFMLALTVELRALRVGQQRLGPAHSTTVATQI